MPVWDNISSNLETEESAMLEAAECLWFSSSLLEGISDQARWMERKFVCSGKLMVNLEILE